MNSYSFMMPDLLGPEEPFDERMDYFREIIEKCKGNVVFLGGAGVSTGSGIPDFRSKNGLYNNMDAKYSRFEPEFLLSHNCYAHKPQMFYKFYRDMFDLRKFEPCTTHKKLAELEEQGVLKGVITQNVDMLHEKAGSKNIIKIHATVGKYHCVRCSREFDEDWFFSQKTLIPRCDCGGQVRPNVVLYNEAMPADAWSKAQMMLEETHLDTECLIVAGTSLSVGAAEYLVANFKGRYLVIINNQETKFDKHADICFREDMNEVFSKL